MPPLFLAPVVLLFFLAAPAGAADFRPTVLEEPELSPLEPVKAPESAELTMDDLQRFAMAVEFEEGGAAPAQKAARWQALAVEAPRVAEAAEARARQWEVKSYALAMLRERAARTARAEDWARLSGLLAADGPSSAEKAEWAARYVRAYEAFPGFGIADLDGLLPLVPAGPLKDRLGRSRDAALAALKAALERQALSRPELRDGLERLGAELVFAEEGGARVLAVVAKKGGAPLFSCKRGFSGSAEYPDIDAGAFADEVVAFLRGGAR